MKTRFKLFLVILCCSLTTMAGTSPEKIKADNITDAGSGKLLAGWIELHLYLIRHTKGISQGAINRNMVFTSIATYESIVYGDPKHKSLGGQLQDFPKQPAPPQAKNFCWAASANAAYATTLRLLYGAALQLKVDSAENYYAAQFEAAGCSKEAIRIAADYGKAIATTVVKWSKTDGSATQYPPYAAPKGEGLWETTPPDFPPAVAPNLSKARLLVKGSADHALPPPPPAFSKEATSPFYKMVDEVYTTSQTLSPEQKNIALFWDDFPDGRYYGGVGHWASIARQVIVQKNLSLVVSVEAMTKMSICLSEAMSACFKAKYTYNVLRPVTYITRYMNHPEWQPLIVTPAHPEYPAAHASISMAAATALTDALGNNVSFTDHTYDDLGFPSRSFSSFEAAAKEAGVSRLYGGIHYQPSIDAGFELGRVVADNVLKGVRVR